MANKKILVFQDQIESLCRMGQKYRVIGGKGGLALVEEEAPEPEMELEG